ncbi:pentatricopeptide repeat-containing protein At2g27800, mitochondrial-like [Mercurialis annua]|uniref:pentatricopeptide repeat-containing protein At2g27800, mitochondrial-like n=1 Tax=Mercurialis annua TaxID=3986 RepID=UPI00215E3EAD|nr:pentatricopeptide repeat-containing protein At2g27800, mitochondrial-like [Mercurialis annua]XP_050213361.1 pentatricopeptide repeat-containing protein At2g27800, mitochondrial-like [Mercurialis annua]XP_050213362.1 pentatricopeptide repeat-containing protein At2g27800, mitochondrial-like [Mercurialis annua]
MTSFQNLASIQNHLHFQMISTSRHFLTQIYSKIHFTSYPFVSYHSNIYNLLNSVIAETQISPGSIFHSNPIFNHYSTKPLSRSYRRRQNKRLEASKKPVLNQPKFQETISQLPPRFTNEELCNVLTLEQDPLVCLEVYNWASQQHRFNHDALTYHIIIKKLGSAKMYEEMDNVVNHLLSVPNIGNEPLYNTVIYFFTEARKLTRAVNIFKHMRESRCSGYRPSIRTYNSLFTAMLSRGRNSYVNYMYMETIRCLFRQMVSDGIEPDVYALNSMIKGYVLANHVNDALRIFHQMEAVYKCVPNAFSYDCLVHGLCVQGRTRNARELYDEMGRNGFVLSCRSYNSLVNAFALGGEVDQAVSYFWEMIGRKKPPDFITYRTILDEICRQERVGEAMRLLKEWQDKDLVHGPAYGELLDVLEDDNRNSNDKQNADSVMSSQAYGNHNHEQS